MALESRVQPAVLSLGFDMGLDLAGKPITRYRSFSNIKAIITDQDIYDVATEIVGLQSKPVIGVYVNDKTELVTV